MGVNGSGKGCSLRTLPEALTSVTVLSAHLTARCAAMAGDVVALGTPQLSCESVADLRVDQAPRGRRYGGRVSGDLEAA